MHASWADVAEAERLLGFEPRIDFEEGLRRTADYLLGEKGLADGTRIRVARRARRGLRLPQDPRSARRHRVRRERDRLCRRATTGFHHFHDTQDELYFVHAGQARVEVEGEERILGPGGLLHVGVDDAAKGLQRERDARTSSCSSSAARAATSSATATWSTRRTSRAAPRSERRRYGLTPRKTRSRAKSRAWRRT